MQEKIKDDNDLEITVMIDSERNFYISTDKNKKALPIKQINSLCTHLCNDYAKRRIAGIKTYAIVEFIIIILLTILLFIK